MQNSTFLASLCSLGDRFESHFVGKPEYRFCRNEAHLLFQGTEKRNSLQPIYGPKSKLQAVSAKSIAGEEEEKESRFVSTQRPKQCQMNVDLCLVDALHARIQKVLREGVQLWQCVFSWWEERGSKYHNTANIGPPAKRHLNGVSLACWWWPNIESWFSSLVIFRGSGPVLLWNPIFLWFFRGGGPDPLSLLWIRPCIVRLRATVISIQMRFKTLCSESHLYAVCDHTIVQLYWCKMYISKTIKYVYYNIFKHILLLYNYWKDLANTVLTIVKVNFLPIQHRNCY